MSLQRLITTDGSLLQNSFSKKEFVFLKNDPFNHFFWKSSKKKSSISSTKKLENFKTRFLKK